MQHGHLTEIQGITRENKDLPRIIRWLRSSDWGEDFFKGQLPPRPSRGMLIP